MSPLPGRWSGVVALSSSPAVGKIYGCLMRAPETNKPGLSVFLPAYNDSGTIASLVITSLKTAARLTLSFGSLGNIRTETLRVFNEAEFRKVVSSIP